MAASVFDHHDYKQYLNERLPTQGIERGARSRLAKELQCQPAFVSQVLGGALHFSLEHAAAIDDFLGHTGDESRFFFLLVQQGRAGTAALRRRYEAELVQLRQLRQPVGEKVRAQEQLSVEASHRYYSAWYYAAIHVLLLVPGMGNKKAIAERLALPLPVVTEALDFLVREGLADEKSGVFYTSARRVHLGNDSSMIRKHHSNWRVKSLQALDAADPLNLHYSGPIAVSHKNAERMRGLLLDLIEKSEAILAEPNEEELYGLTLDFFRA